MLPLQPQKVDAGGGQEPMGAGKMASGIEGMGYFAQPMAEGAANAGDPAGQGMERELWQETDTMYDNLPFDPAYRTSIRTILINKHPPFPLPHASSSIRLGSSKPRIRHAFLHVCRFRHRHDPNPSFKFHGPALVHAR